MRANRFMKKVKYDSFEMILKAQWFYNYQIKNMYRFTDAIVWKFFDKHFAIEYIRPQK